MSAAGSDADGEPAMSEDLGDIDPDLAAALRSRQRGWISRQLLESRVLVPVVADGNQSTAADMAVPGLVGDDGRLALPVFSSAAALRAWNAEARPVPMPGRQAVAAAITEGYAAVVLDVAGPVAHILELDQPGGSSDVR
jgi:hypothetical protein